MLTALRTPLHIAWQFVRPRAAASRLSDHNLVAQIRDAESALRRWPDRRLQLKRGQNYLINSSAPFIFAAVQEAVRRALGIRLFDVQLLAGLALARGAIAEMATGEGKTLAAALPAALFSLAGKGVHVVTPNSYLAGRDFAQLQPVFRLLGISVGLLRDGAATAEKQAAYACDITYGTGYEFGFDYLRDQLAAMNRARPALGQRLREQLQGQSDEPPVKLQRGHAAAIIDEIDSVLLDEACLPLVLSDAPTDDAALEAAYVEADRLSQTLALGSDFVVDDIARGITLTERGMTRVHQHGTQGKLRRPWSAYVTQALAARLLHQRDVGYVVADGKVQVVDEFTGRIFADRIWRDGMHQALEVKEGLRPSAELCSAARISRQRYFRLYRTICGMTGTATDGRREFQQLYRLPVAAIPLRSPCRRMLLPDRYFRDAAAKWQAVAAEVKAIHATGRPVLIGSRTIENSQVLAGKLAALDVPFQLLNGRQDRDEAEIVAQAGQRGAVTIATNMAGRGSDIRLGPGVAALGGLHVIGVERHESARIDRQLLGRAGRQGDPGSGQFYVSADDSLLVRFAPRLRRRMQTLPPRAGEIRADLSHDIAAAQRRAEKADAARRRALLAHDQWLDDWLAALVKEA